MPIPNSILGRWSHHAAATAPVQAHTSIRAALTGKDLPAHDVLLQGSYKNDTNLRKDSDVDVVVLLHTRVRPKVAALVGSKLEIHDSHKIAYDRWKSFRDQVLRVLRAEYGSKPVTSGRKSIKLAKGRLPAPADVVVTLRHSTGVAFFLPDEHRWVASYPQEHYANGVKKEKATGGRYKRTVRMFKAARHELIRRKAIRGDLAPFYFIECLVYNVPDGLMRPDLGQTYHDAVTRLSTAKLKGFKCQNGVVNLVGPGREQWNAHNARRFVLALKVLWDQWDQF